MVKASGGPRYCKAQGDIRRGEPFFYKKYPIYFLKIGQKYLNKRGNLIAEPRSIFILSYNQQPSGPKALPLCSAASG